MSSLDYPLLESHLVSGDSFLCDVERFYISEPNSELYLTKRELECVCWMRQGKTAEEVAIILGISKRTVEQHITSMKKKFGCTTLFQLGGIIGKLSFVRTELFSP